MSLRSRFKKKNEYPFSKALLHELSELFFCEGYKLYSGQNSLSLTAQFLSNFLNYYETYTSNHSQNIIRNSLRFNVNSAAREMNYIRECFEKVQSLKILVDVRYPLENPIQLFPFTRIKVLVIKKCPIKLIHGLKKLRRQLQTFVLNYSISIFDEAIVECGGDETNGEEWFSLDELDLSYNFMSEVVDSRWSLVHSITKLDLSHNQLCEERTDFRELDKLLQINLGYNFLKNIPFFHSLAMGSLHTLILRNNNLSALDGIETLRQLSILDLGYNCLDLHSKLDRIDSLHFLQNLQLTGNPLSYHKKHRQFTLMKLSPAIDVDKFILDDVSLSISESKEFHRNAQLTTSYPSSLSSPSHFNYFSSSSSQSHSSRGGRKISSIRTIELDDTDSHREFAPIEDYPHRDVLREKEVLRTQLGKAWLPSQDSQEESPQRMPLNRSKHKHTHHTLPPQTKLLLDGDTSSYSKPDSPIVTTKLATLNIPNDNLLPEAQQGYHIESLAENYSPMQKHPEQLMKNSLSISRDDESLKTPVNEDQISISPKLIDEEHYLVYSYDTDDEESQREPFFISLSGRRLYELNYEGKAIQEYDMNSLVSATHSVKKSNSQEGEIKQILTLKFNYQRRDMRKRDYIFEKAENFKLLIEKLTEIAANNASKPMKSAIQCLKCNSLIDKTQMLYSYSTEDVTKSIVSDSINCPKCGSEQLAGDSKLTSREREMLDSGPGFMRKLTPCDIRSSLPLQRDLNFNSGTFKPASVSPKSNTDVLGKKGNPVGKKESCYFSENKFTKYRGKKLETEVQTTEDSQVSDFEKVLLRKASHSPSEIDLALESTNSRRESIPEVDMSSIKSCDKVVGRGSFRRRNKQPCPKLSESMIANDARGLTKTHVDDSNSLRAKPLMRPRLNTSPLEELQEYSSQSESDHRNSIFSCGSFIFPSRSSTGPEGIGLPFSFHDPSYIRHDFKLYIEVKLFENNTEEFLSQIRCSAVQTRQKDEFQCLLIISTQAAYICLVKGSEEYAPAEWLSKLMRISLNNLFFIDIGLHGQTLQLEFNNVKNGAFVFITRDTLRTKIFVASLSGYVSKLKHGCLQRVGPDLQTIPNFRSNVLGDSSPTFSEKYVLGLRLYEILRYTSDLIKTHRFNKRSVHSTILGSNLVDFLTHRNEATTIEDACVLIQQCINCKVLNPLEPLNGAFDPEKTMYYRFSMDELEDNASPSNGRPAHIEKLTEIEQLEVYCLLYQIEYKYTSHVPEKKPIGLAITEDYLYLVQQNFQWPLPRLQPPPQLGIRWRQFELRDRRRLTDIEKVLINSNSQSISFVFSTDSIHETPHYEEWNLCTESSRMAELVVATIKNIWEKQYNVELNILITDTTDD